MKEWARHGIVVRAEGVVGRVWLTLVGLIVGLKAAPALVIIVNIAVDGITLSTAASIAVSLITSEC